MCGGGGSAKRASNAAMEQQQKQAAEAEKLRLADVAREEARQAQIRQATSAVNTSFDNTFNDDFFSNLSKKYIDAYSPQLNDQFTQARTSLALDLADRGLTNSSVAADQYGKIQDKFNTAQQGIQSKAGEAANTAKSNAASTRANLINQANAGSDLNTINNLVTSNLQTLQAPQTYDPLGDIFGQLAMSAAAAGVSRATGQNGFTNSGVGVSGTSGGRGVKVY